MVFQAEFESKTLGFFDTEKDAWFAIFEEYVNLTDIDYEWTDQELDWINESVTFLESLVDEPETGTYYLSIPAEFEDFEMTVQVTVEPVS